MPRFLGSDYVFTTTGNTSISGFSRAKRRVYAAVATTDWRTHDLRRTAASGMARLGVPPHVVEKVLNHKSGIISGVAAVYNRYGYEKEKREALERWADHLTRLKDIHSQKSGTRFGSITSSNIGTLHCALRQT
jgi:integrase